jgi:hypothetical protein
MVTGAENEGSPLRMGLVGSNFVFFNQKVIPETQSRFYSGTEKGGFSSKQRMVPVPRTVFGEVAVSI